MSERSGFGDMGWGHPVDPVTGLPYDEVEDNPELRQMADQMIGRLNDAENQGAFVLGALTSGQYGPVIDAFVNQLMARVQKLIEEDEYCAGILKGFEQIRFEIDGAQVAVEYQMKRILGPYYDLVMQARRGRPA